MTTNFSTYDSYYGEPCREEDVIPLPGICPRSIKACSVSNCVYVHNAELDQSTNKDSLLRITKAEDQLFKMSPWINDLKLSLLSISVWILYMKQIASQIVHQSRQKIGICIVLP